jgi:hypothetical protein
MRFNCCKTNRRSEAPQLDSTGAVAGFATTSGVASSFTTGSTFCLPNTYNMAQAEEISLETGSNRLVGY